MSAVGIAEVAARAGVSTATVSRALSGRGQVSAAAREAVQQAARELGYVVSSTASSLASGRTRNVGVVLPFLNRWFFTSVLEGAQQALLRAGYDVTLYNLSGGGAARTSVFEDFLLRQRVDAVIAVSLELAADEVARLHALGKPVVGVGGPVPGVHSLVIDDVAVARLATRHLLGLGHSRIAHIGGSAEFDADFHLPLQRRQGYAVALQEAGLSADPRLDADADFTIEGGYAAARRLLDVDDRPTAIFAASDEMAFGALLAARDLGLDVPRDVSVIGIDDHDHAAFFGLTTVAQHPHDQGARAAAILLEQIDPSGEVSTDDIPLPFDLVVRTSTAPPPA